MPDDANYETLPSYSTTTYSYKSVEGHEIKLDIHRTTEHAPLPAIVWLHGGGLILGSRRMLPAYQLSGYLAAGFAVVAIDYRLAPETKAAAILTDVADAYRWVAHHSAEIGIDGRRLALVGHSAGAYLALSAGLHLKAPPQAIVSFYGYGDISGQWATQPNDAYRQQGLITANEAFENVGRNVISASTVEERIRMYLYVRQQGIWARTIVGDDYDEPEVLRNKYCPLYAVTSDYPPTLLLHGDEDIDVPVSETVSLAERFAFLKVPHRQIILQGYGHGFDVARNAIESPEGARAIAVTLSFLNCYL